MESKTKYELNEKRIKEIFNCAGIDGITNIEPLGAGEYNAVYSVTAASVDYVLKIAPDEKTPVLTYERNIMRAEVFWYTQLRKHTVINVPKIFFTDFSRSLIDADYFIMEKLDAVLLDKMNFNKSEKKEAQKQTAKMAAQMHRIKNDKFGYIQGKQYKDWYTAIRGMVNDLISDCERAGRRTRRGEQLLRYIDIYRDILEKAECTMVNFDIHGQNIMCKKEGAEIKYCLIDPERSFWGDRILDFCSLEFAKPLNKKSVTLTGYNSISDVKVTGNSEERIRCAIGQAYLALILEAEKYYRYTPHSFAWLRNALGSAFLYIIAFRELKK